MSLQTHWDDQYREEDPIWNSGQPTPEVRRAVTAERIRPGRALELGCGTGSNALWLARHGFAVTAIDLSPTAVERATARAREAGLRVRFLCGDLRRPDRLDPPYEFVLDCGCFGAVQRADAAGYVATLAELTAPGSLCLILTGNAHEPEDEEGPPVLTEEQLVDDFVGPFAVVCLREFRFEPEVGGGNRYLGWSCLLRRTGKA